MIRVSSRSHKSAITLKKCYRNLSLAGSLRDDLMRGHGEARHFLVIAERSDFWITPQVPDQDDVIDHCPTPPAARAFPKASPAIARSHLGSHRDRRPAAAAPLLRAQPRAAPANFSGWPSQPLPEGPARKVRCPECAQRDLSVQLGAAGPCPQTRDRRGSLRLARRLGLAAVAGRRRHG